ncbi:uncharacterized protein F4812DRAFT_460249 [Daldinia caldariorum]|uniref:uncharacterized protein n=1 Tax=Daldinia caldariorum TaxID=326644 RepID=UPI00200802CB|nr:uncharacterized protein F4812DRAFT_460249 [Daldinia caldariorum]KAI1466688.1 hypothetical protein F4812DRAFT_460249 [Daldinia caldariorum]
MSRRHIGYSGIYGKGDQANYRRDDIANEAQHHKINAQGFRTKDQNEAMTNMIEEHMQDGVAERYKHDPTYSATMHGHKPSRGAKTDADIQREEEEIINRKKEKTDSLPGKKL